MSGRIAHSSSNLDIYEAMVRSCQAEQSVQDHFDALLRLRVSAQVTGPAWDDLIGTVSQPRSHGYPVAFSAMYRSRSAPTPPCTIHRSCCHARLYRLAIWSVTFPTVRSQRHAFPPCIPVMRPNCLPHRTALLTRSACSSECPASVHVPVIHIAMRPNRTRPSPA